MATWLIQEKNSKVFILLYLARRDNNKQTRKASLFHSLRTLTNQNIRVRIANKQWFAVMRSNAGEMPRMS
ncbi:hypothetical protein An11g02930 [Aspergillus niger]|uniref:Uncharacterized protein n=2 Tax=Aspergillus niger TaxID=5061 RepID=A2QVX1_ASPNC|nr:hypothetical protein An11g02930 [Aspergillus niger]CAK40625.1 hypothetical protein An11g02930 [Aspergillus niger]